MVLLILAGGLYAALGILDMIRGRILVRIANSLDEAVSERVYDALVHIPLVTGSKAAEELTADVQSGTLTSIDAVVQAFVQRMMGGMKPPGGPGGG